MKRIFFDCAAAFAMAALLLACSPTEKAEAPMEVDYSSEEKTSDAVGDGGEKEEGVYDPDGSYTDDVMSEPGEGGDEQGEVGQAGRVTAGEWNDLDNWSFWGGLMTSQDYSIYNSYWGFWTNNRVAVAVENGSGAPLAGVGVSLVKGNEIVWKAVTDNMGRAECWIGLFQQTESVDVSAYRLQVKDVEQEVKLTAWDCPNGADVNKVVLDIASPAAEKADIAFIVDATGSMMDEISFLQQDLMDILNKVGKQQSAVTFRSAAIFYRDEGDEYITRSHNFTDKISETVAFIAQQEADGGGDYPEAVHTALEKGLQELSWSEDAKTRIAFLLLDAPAHHQNDVVASLQQSIRSFAAAGIKIIPISASGIDKGTEFMLRYFAAATNGTYVFITNHSGIGGEHIEATVGDYEVELLNELIVRLINKYTE